MKEGELKTCPFCGSDAVIKRVSVIYNTERWGDVFQVECMKCDIHSARYETKVYRDKKGEIVIEKDGKKDAIDAWNKRA